MNYRYIVLSFLFTLSAMANVELPLIFSDGMVLQQNQDIPIWGWAEPGEAIQVTFKGQIMTTVADQNGKWKVILAPETYGGPFVLEVKGHNTLIINDVYVGEVWLCSGQSNMEFTVKDVLNAQEEMADANFPLIRQFHVEREMSKEPIEQLKGGSWKEGNVNNIQDFSAVGYFFAKKIHQELKVPVGIINASWGGTCVETWTSTAALAQSDDFSDVVSAIPDMELEDLEQRQKQQSIGHIESLQGEILPNLEADFLNNKTIDDSQWPEMEVPNLWENQQLPNLDGVVWLRKTITISKKDANKSAVLSLAKIDDIDITYINGVEIGTTGMYNLDRVYTVPKGVLQPGVNIIMVKVTDTGGGGGIYGDATEVKLTIGDKIYPLSGAWKYNVTEVFTQFSPNSLPSLLFNAMINPLIPYRIKGVLWYQGENNVERAEQYKNAFPLMINDWRSQWQQTELPFYFVQLSSFNEANGNSNTGSKWAELREAQTYALETVKNTGMAVTIDIGDAVDIHPRNKQDVGLRLAAIALNNDYGKEQVFSGPKFKKHEVKNNYIILNFDNLGSGLKIGAHSNILGGFEIAGEDQKFHKAVAEIKDDIVVVHSAEVDKPIAVRYGWADDAGACNLYNQENFPAIPFRTDTWKLTTDGAMYQEPAFLQLDSEH